MFKTLLVMRHAKSSWANSGIADYDRPLNSRGRRDAPRMGEWIAEQKCIPNHILSSTAARAAETTQLLVDHCTGVEHESVEWVEGFYHAPATTYLERLATLHDPSVDIVMVVGHNPGLEELVMGLSGDYETMPTAAVARFRLEIETWNVGLNADNALLVDLWRPKEIG